MVSVPMEPCRRAETTNERSNRPVRLWLYGVAALVFVGVIVAGIARLTESPAALADLVRLVGHLPPFAAVDWAAAAAHCGDPGVDRLPALCGGLDDLRAAAWWQGLHRMLGHALGAAFLLPFVVFVGNGTIPRPHVPRYLALFALGALAGPVGWAMSAAVGDTGAALRLAVDRTLSAVVFAAVLWTALTLSEGGRAPRPSPFRRIGAGVVLGWVVVQIFLGGLVSGVHAGFVYETWPLMDGAFVPAGLLVLEPVWENLVANPAMVQFLHRIGAYVLFALVLGQFVLIVMTARTATARVSAFALGFAVAFQIMVGIATLLMHVPFSMSLIHQAMALVVLATAVVHAVSVFAPGRMETTLPLAAEGV